MIHTIQVQHDAESDCLFIELPKDLLDKVGWSIGDNIKWTDNKNGSFLLTKESNADNTQSMGAIKTHTIHYKA
jgi:hypothetical protein